MKDLHSDLEKELMGLSPSRTSTDFEQRISDALGLQGELLVQDINIEEKVIPLGIVRNWIIAASLIFLLGFIGVSIYFQKFMSQTLANSPIAHAQPDNVKNIALTPDSLPMVKNAIGPWQPRDREAILVEVRNEGIVREPELPPAQQFRYRYYDTSTFTDTADNSRMRVTVPREQVFQVKLEPY
ncbi:MAG: hypothetical protein HOL08_13960 [Opitutae bacterium]|nr:hypothetical protein [Opitutae bacterium]